MCASSALGWCLQEYNMQQDRRCQPPLPARYTDFDVPVRSASPVSVHCMSRITMILVSVCSIMREDYPLCQTRPIRPMEVLTISRPGWWKGLEDKAALLGLRPHIPQQQESSKPLLMTLHRRFLR